MRAKWTTKTVLRGALGARARRRATPQDLCCIQQVGARGACARAQHKYRTLARCEAVSVSGSGSQHCVPLPPGNTRARAYVLASCARAYLTPARVLARGLGWEGGHAVGAESRARAVCRKYARPGPGILRTVRGQVVVAVNTRSYPTPRRRRVAPSGRSLYVKMASAGAAGPGGSARDLRATGRDERQEREAKKPRWCVRPRAAVLGLARVRH